MQHKDYIAKLNKDGDYHSPLAHCQDVAALATVIVQLESKDSLSRLADGLGIDERSACAWVAYLAGLHDLMKLSWAFQLMGGIQEKGQELRPDETTGETRDAIHQFCERYGYHYIWSPNTKNETVSPIQHALLLPAVLPAVLTKTTGVGAAVANALTIAPSGHHSCFPTRDIVRHATSYVANPWHDESAFNPLRLDLAKRLWDQLSFPDIQLPKHVKTSAVLQIAYLIQRADHCGSREHRFPLLNGDCLPWEQVQEHAARVVAGYGYEKLDVLPKPTFTSLGIKPRAMQQIVAGLDLSQPYAMFIKAGTGKGKTIASIYAALQGTGFVFAANNQTTASSLYRAVHDVVQKAHPDLKQAVALAHANRNSFIENFQEQLIQDNPSDELVIRGSYGLQAEGITDCLTARYLVATVDQILMSTFNDGRAVYRLQALIQKVNIIDEIHSLDGRLTALLKVYLTIMGKFKVPVIMLSATIASSLMNEFMQAWANGAGIPYEDVCLQATDEVIILGQQVIDETALKKESKIQPLVFPVDRFKTAQKEIPITFFGNEETKDGTPQNNSPSNDVAPLIMQRLTHVRRLTYMGPTARNVQNLYSLLAPGIRAQGLTPICFTARFTPRHRQGIEGRIEAAIGKNADHDSNLVLFATSVCREGHNWDWDELICGPDLMPNLIQAVGRTDRFNRPARKGKPSNLFIQRPFLTYNSKGDPDGISLGDLDWIIGGSSQFGYRKFYALQTYFLLQSLGKMTLPWDAQALVDRSYDLSESGYPAQLPGDWEKFWDSCKRFQQGVSAVEASTIAGITIPTDFDPNAINQGYDLFGEFTLFKYEKQKHQTRQIFGSQSFYISDEADDPLSSTPFPDLRTVQLNTVTVSNQQAIADATGDLVPDAWSKNRAVSTLPRLVIGVPTRVVDKDNRPRRLLYTKELGLQID